MVATGNPTPSYQWRKDGTDISGANADTLSFTGQPSDAGDYTVFVSNSEGSVLSSVASLTIEAALEPPTISSQPSDASVLVGQAVTFAVVATGNPTPSYQWRKNGTALANEVDDTLTFTSAEIDDQGSYDVVVSNSEATLISDEATLSVSAGASQPSITGSFVVNSTSVVVSFSEPMTSSIEQLDSYSVSDGVSVVAAVQTAPNEVTLTTTALINGVNYVLFVTNVQNVDQNDIAPGSSTEFEFSADTDFEIAFVVANPANLDVGDAAVEAQLVLQGYTVVLTDDRDASPESTSTADAVIISSSITHGLVGNSFLNDTRPVMTWEYQLYDDMALTGEANAVDFGRLSRANREITLVDLSLGIGSSAGAIEISNRNRRDGWGIPVASGTVVASLEDDASRAVIFAYEAGVARADGGSFAGRRLAFPNGWADVFTPAGVTLFEQSVSWLVGGAAPSAPTITTQPQSQAVPEGQSATFSVAAAGGGLNYQWRRDGSDIDGATAIEFSTSLEGSYSVRVSNEVGTVTSNEAALTLLPPLTAPVFDTQPSDLVVSEGESVSFIVVATGNPIPTLQWQFEGVDIPAATSATLSFTAVLANAGSYQLVASNSEGEVASESALLVVNQQVGPPVIATQPVDTSVAEGGTASFTVVAGGNPAPTYQWRNDGVALAGETASSLLISDVGEEQVGNYDVVVSNSEGTVTSVSAALSIANDTTPPTTLNVALVVANPASLGAADAAIVGAIEALDHSVLLVDDDTASLASTAAADLVVISLSVSHGKIGNTFLGDPRPVMVMEYQLYDDMQLTGATTNVDFGRTDSTSREVDVIDLSIGIGASLGVTQITSGTRRYGWGIAGNEATVVATLVNEPTRATLFAYDAGSARAISGVFAGRRLAWPTGSANVFVSEGAALFADAITWLASGDSLPTGSAPTFLTNPADLVVAEGELASFSVSVAGDPTPVLQWQKDGVALNGENEATLSFSATLLDAGTYSVVASNALGSTSSVEAQLSVTQQQFEPVISVQPQAVQVDSGQTAVFSVVATGNPTPDYQWRRDGAELSGETSSTLTLSATTTADAGVYDVLVANSEGSVISDAVELTVLADSTAPTLENLSVIDESALTLTFNEPVTSSATLLSNYNIDQGVVVLSATQDSPTQVTLGISTLSDTVEYTLTVSDVQDLALNSIAAGTASSFTLSPSIVEFALVVPNPSNLSAADAAVQTSIEALGHSVVLVDDNLASPETTVGSNVIIISSTVVHTLLNANFLTDVRPIWIWEYQLFDDLGLTGFGNGTNLGRDTTNNRNLLVVDVSTGIGVNTGLLELTTRNRRDGWGIPATDATVVATLEDDSTRATIFSYQQGDTGANGEAMAGRRLAWPHGSVDVLSSDGAELFNQSVEWLLE